MASACGALLESGNRIYASASYQLPVHLQPPIHPQPTVGLLEVRQQSVRNARARILPELRWSGIGFSQKVCPSISCRSSMRDCIRRHALSNKMRFLARSVEDKIGTSLPKPFATAFQIKFMGGARVHTLWTFSQVFPGLQPASSFSVLGGRDPLATSQHGKVV